MVVIRCSSFSTVSNVKGFAFVVGCTARHYGYSCMLI